MKYLGHIVSEEGIQTDPGKTSAVDTWPMPKNVKELRQFLGFRGYYRRFIENYAQIVQLLNRLLEGHLSTKQAKVSKNKKKKKAVTWEWGDAQQNSFDTVKQKLTSPPILAYANYSLRQPERRYPVHKLEFLALKWSVTDKFRDYLYGSSFKVVTDSNPLTYVLTSAKVDATSLVGRVELLQFHY